MERVRVPAHSYGCVQGLADLRGVLVLSGPAPFGRIARLFPGLPDEAAFQRVAAAARISARDDGMHEALSLAAALPGDDEAAFVAATALLLADALQGAGHATALADHYEAHAGRYRTLRAPVRAAIFNGFRLLACGPAPALADRASRPLAEVRAGLAGAPARTRGALAEALEGGHTGPAEALWRSEAEMVSAAPPLADAMRHLYETRDDWNPYRGWDATRLAREAIAIPFVAP